MLLTIALEKPIQFSQQIPKFRLDLPGPLDNQNIKVIGGAVKALNEEKGDDYEEVCGPCGDQKC